MRSYGQRRSLKSSLNMDKLSKALKRSSDEQSGLVSADAASKPPAVDARYTRPSIGTVGKVEFRETIVALDFENPVSNIFRLLRSQVMSSLVGDLPACLGIASAMPKDGKTFVAVNLAASMALFQERTVVLIDLDLRKPSVSTYFSGLDGSGLTNCLRGEGDIEQYIYQTPIDQLFLVPAGRPIRNSSEALGSSKLTDILQRLRQIDSNPIIVCDLPPVLLNDDVLAIQPSIDGFLVVIADEISKPDEVTRVIELIDKEKLIGTVLNKSQTAPTANNYYY